MFLCGLIVGGGLTLAFVAIVNDYKAHAELERTLNSEAYAPPDPTLDLVFDHNAFDLAFVGDAIIEFVENYNRKPRRIVIVEGLSVYGLPVVMSK